MPLHSSLVDMSTLELPWTISYVVRKRTQIDGLNELPKEKRPPDRILWWGSPEELEDWIDLMYDKKGKQSSADEFILVDVSEDDIG